MTQIARLCVAAVAALAASMLAGCANINVGGGSSDYQSSPSAAPAPAPEADGRTAAQLAGDNHDLRVRLATLEDHNRRWQASVDSRKQEIRQLKDQRDDLKKDRDRAKKALKNDD